MSHILNITTKDLLACREIASQGDEQKLSRGQTEGKLIGFLRARYVYAPRELDAFLNDLFARRPMVSCAEPISTGGAAKTSDEIIEQAPPSVDESEPGLL